jgi:3-dehydroquinate synthase
VTGPIYVQHALGRYPVYLGAGTLNDLPAAVAAHCGPRVCALITDTVVGRLYEQWESGHDSSWTVPGVAGAPPHVLHDWATRLSVPPGEQHKTRETWARLTDALLEQGFGRDSGIVALGGGVVGDVAGFVAATYQRGVPYVLVPTTLLAMLDASIGGKTGVDTPHGKNLIGAFHPPAAVVGDPATLRSLPEAEYRSGLSEAVKHGLIADAVYLAWIDANAAMLLARDLGALEQLIRRSVEIKASVVSTDERESGPRSMLNAGHTVAHALEQVSGYGLLHGEAVALGLVAECAMGERARLLAPGTRDRIAAVLGKLGLPARVPFRTNAVRVRQAMARDKKNVAGEVRFAIPAGIGAVAERNGGWTVALDEATIEAGLSQIL